MKDTTTNYKEMKKILFYSLLLFVMMSAFMISCKKEKEYQLRTSSIISIAELREMYKGEALTIRGKDAKNNLLISGIVISNTAHKNNPEGKIIVQNNADGKLRGIALDIQGQIGRYLPGDSIIARIDGATLESAEGVLQVSGLTVAEVGRISVDNVQEVHLTTDNLSGLIANRDIYESTLVKVTSVEVVGVERGQKFADKDLELSDGDNSIAVKTKATATFAATDTPISGDFTGIILYAAEGFPYLSVRSSEDYTGQYMAPEEYYGFPEGWENIIGTRKAGNVSTSGYDVYPSGRWYLFQALTRGQDPQFHNTRDDWTLMMSGTGESRVSMEFDLLFGASEFSFYYSAATKLAGDAGTMGLYVEYSQDSGVTWQQLGSKLTIANDPLRPQYYQEYKELTIEGAVRFRVRKEAGGGRVTIDDIYIKPYQ